MKIFIKIMPAICALVLVHPERSFGQTEVRPKDIYEMSLEELMNVKISSASKKEELQFDAPISSYTITQSDMERAGVTNIPEALRLAPGLIVREETNGNYTVHIRGLDNIQRTNAQINSTNLLTLVMIDSRPVFNNLIGGTNWEALPVSLTDLDRIEIIRGPASALYGPNAVSGVINLITKQSLKNSGSYVRGQFGSQSTKTIAASTSVKKNHWTLGLNGNFQYRERFNTNYYSSVSQNFVEATALPVLTNLSNRYSQPNLAQNIFGYNVYASYSPKEGKDLFIGLGGNSSSAQRAFGGDGVGITPLAVSEFESKYANISYRSGKFTGRGSLISGHDNIRKGAVPSEYDYHVEEGIVEYEINPAKQVNVKPGIGFQNATYDDTKYYKDNGNIGLLGGSHSISTWSGSLRTDIVPVDKLRIILAGRYDMFSVPSKGYSSYQLASTYRLTNSVLFRATVSKSRAGSFIGDHFLNVNIPIAPNVNFQLLGNRNLNVTTISQAEFGTRAKLSDRISIDVDVFTQEISDLIAAVAQTPLTQQIQNLDATAQQTGVTMSMNITPSTNFQVKPFFTYQNTEVKNLPVLVNGAITGTLPTDRHRYTPSYFGGFYLNYRPTGKFYVSINTYYYGDQVQYSSYDPLNTSNFSNVKGKFLVNSKISYRLITNLFLDLTVQNLFDQADRELFALDQNHRLVLFGLLFKK